MDEQENQQEQLPAFGSVDDILSRPLNRIRLKVRDHFFSEGISEELLEAITQELQSPETGLPPEITEAVAKEAKKIKSVIVSGRTLQQPDLTHPAMQLMWGMCLGMLVSHPESVKNWITRTVPESITKTQIWRQIAQTPEVQSELVKQARLLAEELHNKDAIIRWGVSPQGYPNVGYYFDPEKNLVNLDMIWALLSGLEHSRAASLHEIGHSELTKSFTSRMDILYKEIKKLDNKQKAKSELTPEEYKQKAMAAKEWQLRNRLWQEAENNTVNRFVVDQSNNDVQDYSPSINHVEVIACGVGGDVLQAREARKAADATDGVISSGAQAKDLILSKSSDPLLGELEQAEKDFYNVCKAVRQSFYCNNGLFKDEPSAWEEIGVSPEAIAQGENTPSFAEFRQECGGDHGLEHQQPNEREKKYSDWVYENLAHKYAKQRNKIIDALWKEHAEVHAKKILSEYEKYIDEELKKPQPPKQPDQDEQAPNEGGDGECDKKSEQGTGKSAKGQSSPQGKGQSSQPSGGGQDNSQNEGEGHGESSSGTGKKGTQTSKNGASSDAEGDDNDSSQTGKQHGAQKSAGEQTNDDEDGENSGNSKNPSGKSNIPKTSPDGKTVDDSENDASKPPASEDGDKDDGHEAESTVAVKSGGDGNEAETAGNQATKHEKNDENDSGIDDEPESEMPEWHHWQPANKDEIPDDIKTVTVKGIGELPDIEVPPANPEEMMRKILENQESIDPREKTAEEIVEAELIDSHNQGSDTNVKSIGYGSTYSFDAPQASPHLGDWMEYMAMVAPHQATIAYISATLAKIEAQRTHTVPQISRSHTMLPDDGDISRFDLNAQRDLLLKKQRGQAIDLSDYDRFKEDLPNKKIPAPMDVVIMIDGSGSMQGERIAAAVQTGIVLYESAKKANINAYVMMWGNNPPLLLAKPGDHPIAIGKSIAANKNGFRNWGTDLPPAVKSITQAIATREVPPGAYAGYSHYFVISDGDINDAGKASNTIKQLLKDSPHVTFDVALVKPGSEGTGMHQTVEAVREQYPDRCAITSYDSPEKIQQGLFDLLRNRMQACETKAIAYSEKVRGLQNSLQRM